jgi:apolipoprotein N-acyltransferase
MLFERRPDGSLKIQRYHKKLLAPFGERVPFVDDFPFLGELFKWGVGLGSWNREGVDSLLVLTHPSTNVTGPRTTNIAMLICYESVFPTYVRQAVAKGANVIAIVTNDGWYGNSSGPYQHERYAILRAIENRRWIIRSANTGISCVIDDNGRILEELPFNTAGSILADVPSLTSATLYTTVGDAVPRALMWANGAFVVFFVVSAYVEKRRRKK